MDRLGRNEQTLILYLLRHLNSSSKEIDMAMDWREGYASTVLRSLLRKSLIARSKRQGKTYEYYATITLHELMDKYQVMKGLDIVQVMEIMYSYAPDKEKYLENIRGKLLELQGNGEI